MQIVFFFFLNIEIFVIDKYRLIMKASAFQYFSYEMPLKQNGLEKYPYGCCD